MEKFDVKCGKCGSCFNIRAKMSVEQPGNSTQNPLGKEVPDASCPMCGYTGMIEGVDRLPKMLMD